MNMAITDMTHSSLKSQWICAKAPRSGFVVRAYLDWECWLPSSVRSVGLLNSEADASCLGDDPKVGSCTLQWCQKTKVKKPSSTV